MSLDCILLGSGGTVPRADRPLSSLALRLEGAVYLLDCGEGTQVPYAVHHVGVRNLRVVALSHLHADHVMGLPGLLAMRALLEDPGPLTIVGPPGTQQWLVPMLRAMSMRIPFQLRLRELPVAAPSRTGPLPIAYEDELLTLRWLPLEHSVFCAGYRIEEHARPGRFDPRRALARGLSAGPDFGRLQAGHAVTAPDGSSVAPGDVMGPPRPGRTVAFCTDTAPCKNLYRLLDDADLAFIEAAFLPAHEEEARRKQHLTVRDAARICSRADVQRAVLTHLSPRYQDDVLPEADAVAASFSEHYRLGRSGERFELRYRD